MSSKTARILFPEALSDFDFLPDCASSDLRWRALGLGHQEHHNGGPGEETEPGQADQR